MVSTRSVKHKFSEGEKVLCYEPDPLKTKVLYNSKVLGVCLRQDETGRKAAVHEFLIHFQGWNSTWDRFVTEDYILKDTEENRKLQRELAEKAQLTAGGNLYRRGRKRRTLSRTGSDNDRRGGDSDSDGDSGGLTFVNQGLRGFLEFDWDQITNNNKVLKIPCSPNALEILQLWMKEYTVDQIRLMCHKRGHLRPTAGKNAHITVDEILLRANLCQEVADGLRVYLDFMLGPQLLYHNERTQYKFFTTSPLPHQAKPSKKHNEIKHPDGLKENQDAKLNLPLPETDRRKSLRSHSDVSHPNASNPHTPHGNTHVPTASSQLLNVNTSNNTIPQPHVLLTPLNLNTENQTSEDLASVLGQDVVKGGEHLMLRPISWKEKLILRKIVHRKLVPPSFKKHQPTDKSPLPPCLLYGAIHLCRALVKIPETYTQSNINDAKISIVNEYLNLFAKFLEDHPEWFGENLYCDNTYPELPADSF